MEICKSVIDKVSESFVSFLSSFLGSLYATRNKYKDAIIITINRTQAAQLLELNKKNRKIKQTNLKFLKDEMNSGNYRDTGACIVLYWDMLLGDGQHRLKAFLQSELETIEITFRWGDWYDDRFAVTDQGKKRDTFESINQDKFHVTICKFANKFVLSSTATTMGNDAWATLCEKTKEAFSAMYAFDVKNLNDQMFRSPMCTAFCLYYTLANSESERQRLVNIWKKMLVKTREDGSPGNQNFAGTLAHTHLKLVGNRDLASDKERQKCFYLSCTFFDTEFEKNNYKVTDAHKKRINDLFKVLK